MQVVQVLSKLHPRRDQVIAPSALVVVLQALAGESNAGICMHKILKQRLS
jgi:hypothetical protein